MVCVLCERKMENTVCLTFYKYDVDAMFVKVNCLPKKVFKLSLTKSLTYVLGFSSLSDQVFRPSKGRIRRVTTRGS